MLRKSLILPYFIIPLFTFIQCQNKDVSTISFKQDNDRLHFKNENIHLIFDEIMRCKIEFEVDGIRQSMNNTTGTRGNTIPPHFIVLDSIEYKNFRISSYDLEDLEDPEFGMGRRLTLKGVDSKIERSLVIEMYERYPDVAVSWSTYTNRTGKDLKINRVYYNYYRLDRKLTNQMAERYDFRYIQPLNKEWGDTWTNIGITDSTDEDFVIPGTGSNRSGIPFIDVWSPEMGMAIFHVEGIPRFHHLFLKTRKDEMVDMGFMTIPEDTYSQFSDVLHDNASITTWKSAVCTHKNDFFDAGRRFGQFLNGALNREGREGLPVEYPEQAYEPYWKTWGMNSLDGSGEFTIQEVKNKMDLLADYGFKAVMLDAGWFDVLGNWNPDPRKFNNESELIGFIQEAHKPKWGKDKDKSFKVYLWFDLLGSNTTEGIEHLLVRNRDGSLYTSRQAKYTFCPSNSKFLNFVKDSLIEEIINRWDADGLYTDLEDQNPMPCYAEDHHHRYEAESVESNYLAYKTMYNKIMDLKPEKGWISMCACASVHDAYQYPYYYFSDASDPTSNKQVRWRTKWIKAFRGSTAPAGDGYVDKMNYDNKAGDPAMSVSIGSVITSVRWNAEELGGADHARKWMNIYFKEQLYNGEYIGLYDIEYHTPEGYVIRKSDGTMYYTFIDEEPFDKEVELRGLEQDRVYKVIEYDTNTDSGKVSGSEPFLHISSISGNDEGEQVFYYVIKCIPQFEDRLN
jgi:alpha-galactosidase